jgi:hypothetical protein
LPPAVIGKGVLLVFLAFYRHRPDFRFRVMLQIELTSNEYSQRSCLICLRRRQRRNRNRPLVP